MSFVKKVLVLHKAKGIVFILSFWYIETSELFIFSFELHEREIFVSLNLHGINNFYITEW